MKQALRWAVVIVYCGLIFFFSQLPKPPKIFQIRFFSFDKLLHIVEYGMLGLALAWALYRKEGKLGPGAVAGAAFVLSVLYGAADEIHQSFIPGRHATVYDVVADALGAGAGVLLWRKILKWRMRRRPEFLQSKQAAKQDTPGAR